MNKRFFVLLVAALCNFSAYAEDNTQPTIAGKTYGQWSASWWQWIRPIPSYENPELASRAMWTAQAGRPGLCCS